MRAMRIPFEQTVTRHGPTVWRVCRAVLGADDEAEDAWAETFLAALRAWPDLDADTNVEAWLVRVAHRKAVDAIRTRARHAVPTGDPPDRVASGDDPQQHDVDLWRAVAALPERQRLAVAYHYFGGLPHNETAEIIGGTAAAVRRAASDGVTKLRRVLVLDEENEGENR